MQLSKPSSDLRSNSGLIWIIIIIIIVVVVVVGVVAVVVIAVLVLVVDNTVSILLLH